MTNHVHHEEGGEEHRDLDREATLEESLEYFLKMGPTIKADELIAEAKKEGARLDVAKVVLKALKEEIPVRGANREVRSILFFAKERGIAYNDPEVASTFQKTLEKWLSVGAIIDSEVLINIAEEYGVLIDLAPVLQKAYDARLSVGLEYATEIAEFADKKGIRLKGDVYRWHPAK